MADIQRLQERYENLSFEQKDKITSLLKDKGLFSQYTKELKNLLFIKEPPTPEEFLDPKNGYLPVKITDSLFPTIKKSFIDGMNTNNPYNYMVTYGSTRSGKTIINRLFIVYCIIYINYLRFPHLYYQINPMSEICIYMVSFKDSITKKVLLTPVIKILDASKKFKREVFEKSVRNSKIEDDGIIHFSEASKFGSITFPALTIVTGRDPSDFIGGDIVMGTISELNFFKKYSAMSDEEVFEVFTELSDRIQGTIGTNTFPCFVSLDSSANDADSPIESFIRNKLKYNPKCFYREWSRWEIRPNLFPKWQKTRNTFRVITGNGDIPASIVSNDKQLEGIPEELIVDVPIDAKEKFEQNLTLAIKNIAGRPTSNESKLISDSKIINQMFDSNLVNIEGDIKVGASELPEKLIWNKIKDIFFIDEGNGRYRIKRASRELRTLGLDLATSASDKGDIAGISMSHYELYKGKKIVVNDFTLACLPDTSGISLEAIYQFILDLALIGSIRFYKISADTFQSFQTVQNLERNNLPIEKFSVDTSTEPYLNMLMLLHNGLIKVGKNIYLKNNLKSLYKFQTEKGKDKIDHSSGRVVKKYMGNWDMSQCGIHAKDISDALCSSSFHLSTSNIIPITDYELENERINSIPKNQSLSYVDEQTMYRRLIGIRI